MKLVTYRPTPSAAPRVGVLVGESIVDAANALAKAGDDPAHAHRMEDLIQRPRAALDALASAATELANAGDASRVDGVRLEAPIMRPSKVIGLGYNYRALCDNEGVTPGEHPELFVKMPTSVTGPNDPVVVPKVIDKADFEAELGVVIGHRCKDAGVDDALSCVAGYTVINDVTAKIIPRPPESGSVVLGLKGVATFCPTGPCLLTADEVPDPQDMTIVCRVNGEEKQRFHSSDMVHTVAEVIAYISARITLEPGDMISTGTSLGIGIIQKPAGEGEHLAKFTGHGIGLETVEAPLVMHDAPGDLEVGDVICLEPGILHRDAYGARFEYEVVITESGHEVLGR